MGTPQSKSTTTRGSPFDPIAGLSLDKIILMPHTGCYGIHEVFSSAADDQKPRFLPPCTSLRPNPLTTYKKSWVWLLGGFWYFWIRLTRVPWSTICYLLGWCFRCQACYIGSGPKISQARVYLIVFGNENRRRGCGQQNYFNVEVGKLHFRLNMQGAMQKIGVLGGIVVQWKGGTGPLSSQHRSTETELYEFLDPGHDVGVPFFKTVLHRSKLGQLMFICLKVTKEGRMCVGLVAVCNKVYVQNTKERNKKGSQSQ